MLLVLQLASLFFLGTTLLQASRTMTGLGIRLAQDLGVHRKKPDGYRLGFQDELQKRAFWLASRVFGINIVLSNIIQVLTFDGPSYQLIQWSLSRNTRRRVCVAS